MSRVFLGKPLHWLILLALVAAGWFTGRLRLHVTDFNLFLILLIAVTIVAVIAVLATSPKDAAITRDPIVDDDDGSSSG